MLSMLLLQAVAGPVLPAPPRPRVSRSCPVATDPTDVVVCARDQEGFRLHSVAPVPEQPLLPLARLRVGDAVVAARAESGGRPGGYHANRAMLRLTLPLGRRTPSPAP